MSNEGMDGFDWLQSFLPAESQRYHGPNSNNGAYQAHPAFHDAEEVARAAVMHQQAQRSYEFMRSTNPGTNRASNLSQAYSKTLGGHYEGNKHQQTTNSQFNNPPSGPSAYPIDRSQNITRQLNSPVPSQQHWTAQELQDTYRRGQSRTNPSAPPQRPSDSIPNSSETGRSNHMAHGTTRPTAPTQRTNQPMAQGVSGSQSPYQGYYSATQNHRPHMLATPQMAQRTTTQVQRTYAPAESQSPYSHSTIPPYNAQQPPHPTTAQGSRPTPPVQRTHPPIARPEAPQRPYQSHSTASAQNTQQLSVSNAVQRPWPAPPVQRTRTPVAGPQASQSPDQSYSILSQNVQSSSHSHPPPSPHSSIDVGFYTPLVSPKGSKASAARRLLEHRQSITPATNNREASNPSTHNPATNPARSNSIPSGPSFQNQDHMQSAVPTAPSRVNSPATSQAISTRSPPVPPVPSASASASPAPPAQTHTVPHHLDNGCTEEKGGIQGKAPTSSCQIPNQTSQQPSISQPNEQSTPAVSPTLTSSTPPAVSHSGPSYNFPYASGPPRGTFSDSAKVQHPAVGNTQSLCYPLARPSHHQKKRWVPAQEDSSGSMPPAKMQRVDITQSQTRFPQNDSSAVSAVPGAQTSMEYARPRGPGKILKNRDDLVQQIRPSDALPKHSYDPTTIARDVLIATGRHPTEKHLNHHLDALRHNFTKIDYFADLATFRWDLVDAKQPESQFNRMLPVPTPQTPHVRLSPHPQPPQVTLQSVQCDPHGIPNNVTTRDYVPMPSRDTPPNRQVAMPARIDARAPPSGLSAWGILPFKPPTYQTPQRIFPSNLPSGLPRLDPDPASPKFSSHRSVPLQIPPQPQPQPQPQRRPSTTKSAARPKPPPAAKQATLKSIKKPKPSKQTAKSQSDSGRTVKFPEARRPPQPQVVIPPSPKKMPTKKNLERAPRSAANNIEVAIHCEQPVHYQIFPCKWEGCAAELHNIDSVRAHLKKVHIPHSLVCKWKDCDNKTPMAAADMSGHMVGEHISKIAWVLGDGPTVPSTAENNPTYPSVLGDRSARKGTMVLPVDEHQVKLFSKAHGKSTEKTKAQALLEAGQHWKQQIGPEMDWSDRRLSTPARQARVHCGEMAFIGEN
ncbi:unnamed protein product [Penicillium glandicola]